MILREMLSHMPRESLGFWTYGVPGLHHLASLSLLNVPRVLEKFGYAEVLWFCTDLLGHVVGPRAYLASLYNFDRAIGRFLPLDELEDVNIILYADHGMSFGESGLVDYNAAAREVFGPDLKFCTYPNIYISAEVDRSQKARELVDAGIDFVFYREGETVVACHGGGLAYFTEHDGQFRYTFTGSDPFGYYAAGYRGEALSREEWLELTADLRFPAVPPNVYSYLQNPYVGDFVISITPPKLPKTPLTNKANHTGLTTTDLMVPILLKGPAFEQLRGMETMWLHDLYSEYAPVDFDFVPARDQNKVAAFSSPNGPVVDLELSPAYRLRSRLEMAGLHSASLGVEWDLYSTFLSRIWLGAGAKVAPEESAILVGGVYELTLGRLSAAARFTYEVGPNKWELAHSLAWNLTSQLSAVWQIGRGVGVQFTW